MTAINTTEHDTTNGVILYEGPSMLDGAPIVAIATGTNNPSRNPKTGPMIQVWILRADLDPVSAVSQGADASICGHCPHRGDGNGKARSCYVNVFAAPGNVYRTFRDGGYLKVPAFEAAEIFRGRMVRLGAYGDPAAVPFGIVAEALSHAAGWTGYTHQWRNVFVPAEWSRFVMASCDCEADKLEAKNAGWRTFRVRLEGEALHKREIACPASDEAGKRTTCFDCALCGGLTKRAADIAIIVHGSKGKTNAFAKRAA